MLHFANNLLKCLNYSLKTRKTPDLLKSDQSFTLLRKASLKGNELSHSQKITTISIIARSKQPADLSKHSTETTLLKVTSDIAAQIDKE